jgi:hypothetical protein
MRKDANEDVIQVIEIPLKSPGRKRGLESVWQYQESGCEGLDRLGLALFVYLGWLDWIAYTHRRKFGVYRGVN